MIDLQERWDRLWHAVGAAGGTGGHDSSADAGHVSSSHSHQAGAAIAGETHAQRVLHELSDRLAEPWRAYHNADHLRACLAEFDRVEYQAKQPNALQWSIWFHDAIYDPRARDNEERSAAWACQVAAEAGLPADFQSAVKEMILATKHLGPPANHDDELMVDIDLAILGQPAAKFDAYDAAIRLEYAHVPEEEYRAGRAKVLRSFLTRPHIYFTAPFRGRYEGMARANLARAMVKLK